MSKIIKILPEHIEQARADFDKYLESVKLSDGKISFTKSLTEGNSKANLYFTEIAWLKMQTLIREFSKEIAWHGVAYRGEDPEKNDYLVTDIMVYPQTVTGASVDMDETEYANWLMENVEDDRFFNIHFQAHSHVNMGTSPSGVDLNHQQDILDMLDPDEGFYIFAIWNKRDERTVRIFDMKKNTLFENSDVTISILNDGTGIESFLEEAKSLVKERAYTPPQTTSNGAYKGVMSEASKYQQQCSSSGKNAAPAQSSDKSKGKRTENWRDGGKANEYKSSAGSQRSAYDYYDDLYGGYGGLYN